VTQTTIIKKSLNDGLTVTITSACLSAAEASLPHISNRHTAPKHIPGWSDRVEPLRQKSLLHGMGCGRDKYHYGVRQVKRGEDFIAVIELQTLLLMIRIAISGLKSRKCVVIMRVLRKLLMAARMPCLLLSCSPLSIALCILVYLLMLRVE